MKTSELIRLVKDVFSEEPGKTLLKEFEEEVLSANSDFEVDPNKLYWRSAHLALYVRWKNMVDMDSKKLAEIEKDEKSWINKPELNEFGDII
jgi:hypothetical protein